MFTLPCEGPLGPYEVLGIQDQRLGRAGRLGFSRNGIVGVWGFSGSRFRGLGFRGDILQTHLST